MICKQCGHTNKDGTNFCENCGAHFYDRDLQKEEAAPQMTSDEQTEKKKLSTKNLYQISYNVDLVLCIDATESMDGILDIVKNNAVNLYNDVINTMAGKKKHIDTLRVRVVAFRDYAADGEAAMLATDFFQLPEDANHFSECVHSIEAKGGGDDPEDGLEALAYAMRSDWNQVGMKKRHVIVLWTDAPTHSLGFGKQRSNYPQDMAKDFQELTSWWGAPGSESTSFMDQYAKRLILFTPECQYWTTIVNNWDKVIQCRTIAGNGLAEQDYETILNVIANTI